MRNPEDESDHGPLRPLFNRRLKLEFHGSDDHARRRRGHSLDVHLRDRRPRALPEIERCWAVGGFDAGTGPIRRTRCDRPDYEGRRLWAARCAVSGRHGDAEPGGTELAESLGAAFDEDVAGWHRVPLHTRRGDGASDGIGAAASHRQIARRVGKSRA